MMQRRAFEIVFVLGCFATAGCVDAAFARLTARATSTGTDGETEGAEPDGAETTVNTVTTASPMDSGDDSSDTDAEPNADAGPRILSFSATPPSLAEAGLATVSIEYTPDVSRFLLFDDFAGEVRLLAELEPGVSTWDYPITSEADFDGEHELHAIVIDDEDRWDEAVTDLSVDLNPAGSLVWVNDGKHDSSTFQSAIAAVADDTGVVVVVRDHNAGGIPSRIRRYDGFTGDVVWETATPEDVSVRAIAQAPSSGDVVIAGQLGAGNDARMWVHQLDAVMGVPTWSEPEDWISGTTANAVTVDQDGGILVVGSETTQAATSAYLWRLPVDPEIEGYLSAKWALDEDDAFATATSVVVSAEGRVFVGGYHGFSPNQLEARDRMTVFEFDDALAPVWVDDEDSQAFTRVNSITSGDGLFVSGWRKAHLNAENVLVLHRLRFTQDEDLEIVWSYEGNPGEGTWIETDVNGRLLFGGTASSGIVVGALSTHANELWDVTYEHGFANTYAGAGATDRWGNAYFTGYLVGDGGWNTVVGKVRP